MQRIASFLLSGLIMAGMILPGHAQQAAPSQAGKPIYVVIHIDMIPQGKLPDLIAMMREYGADSLKEPGAMRFELLQQADRANHFTVVEVWKTREAFEAHTGSEHTRKFREKIQPWLGSPFDERLHVLVP